MPKLTILYFCVSKTSFVEKDIEILKTEFIVKDFLFDVSKKHKLVVLVSQLLFLFKYIFSSKIYIVQFAGHQSFLPVLFSRLFLKKSIIVAGGTDCVSFPLINYGNFSKKDLAFSTSFSFKYSDLILPVHASLVFNNYNYDDLSYKQQGIKAFVKNLKTPVEVIFNGYDFFKWKRLDIVREKNSFVTVGNDIGSKIYGHELKGTDLIFEVANHFPDCVFYVIGGENLKHIQHPKNVILLGVIPNNELINFYNRCEFYLQLSMSEGFPNALCEAMLCECIPIVSAVGAMPDILGECGYILNKRNVNELKDLIINALSNTSNDNLRKLSRKKIEDNYTMQKRSIKLIEAIKNLIK